MALIDGLVSYWNLDETSTGSGAVTRVDAHGSNDLTDVNTVASGTGKLSNGADFESSNSEYLDITNASQTGLNITGSFSIQAWINRESDASNDSGYQIVNRLQADDGYRIAYYRTAGGTNQIRRTIKNATTTNNYDVTTAGSTATWYHLVWTFNSTSKANILYVDGTSVSSQTGTVNPASVSSSFRIGVSAESLSQYFDGLIDEVAIWSRDLTSAEVTELYGAGTPLAYPFTTGSSGNLLTLGVG